MLHNAEKISHAYISKYNLDCGNQVILLGITDGKKWHYLGVKKFYCISCFHSYNTKGKLKKHQKVCENHGYCYTEMPEVSNKILECKSTTKINKHTASGCSLFTRSSFDATKNKLDYYRGKNCMKNFFS